MSHFKEFCDSIPKNKHGYVPDLLDLDSDYFRDLAMSAFIAEQRGRIFGILYMKLSNEKKNNVYSSNEIYCQDAIDAYNQSIDDAREKAKSLEAMDDRAFISLIDPDYKWQRFNQAEIDAGFSGTGKEFC